MDGNFSLGANATALVALDGPTATPAAVLYDHYLTAMPTPFATPALVGVVGNGPLPVGTLGKAALWTGTTLMALPTFVFYRKMLSEGEGRERLFHVLTVTVTAMASMAYLFMALGKGYIWVGDRPLYYMRYVDWLITTPILLLDLCLLASAEAEKTCLLFLMDALMIVGGLLGALITGWSKYFFWLVSTLMFIPIAIELLTSINQCAAKAGPDVLRVYQTLSRLTVAVWCVYPFIWIVGEGTFSISPDLEACLYMIIDVTAKSVFGYLLLASHNTLKLASEVYEFGSAQPKKAEKTRNQLTGIPLDMNFDDPSVHSASHHRDSSTGMDPSNDFPVLSRRPTTETAMFAGVGLQTEPTLTGSQPMPPANRQMGRVGHPSMLKGLSSRKPLRANHPDAREGEAGGSRLLSSLRDAAMGMPSLATGRSTTRPGDVEFTEHADGRRADRAIQANGPEIGPSLWPQWLLLSWGFASSSDSR